jgi:sugar-specific transcriptional regulator TrmB
MDTEQLRVSLEDTGLTQYEADAYVAVLDLGSASATEIADACDVPQARIYDVLRNLERDGYVETFHEGSLHARVLDPSEVLGQLESYADTIATAAEEIKHRYEKPKVENHRVSVVKPLRAVYDRAAEAIEGAENELQVAVTPETFDRFRDDLAAAVDRNVVVLLTLTPEVRDGSDEPRSQARQTPSGDFDELDREFDFEGTATEVRYRRLPTPFLVIADRQQVCFAPEEGLHPTQKYGVHVNDYSLSHMFEWTFETAFWELWPVVYSARDDSLPATYTEIRDCIGDVAPSVADGRDVVVTVYGQWRESGERCQLTGRVTDVTMTRGADGEKRLATYLEEATLQLETADGTVDVGGWGAMFEDVEARRFVVEAIG